MTDPAPKFLFEFDAKVPAAYVYLTGIGPSGSMTQKELAPGVIADYDISGNLIGLEFLGVYNTKVTP